MRTPDLSAVLPHLPPAAGEPVTVSRGALTWRIVLPPDGSMPFGGAFPAVIEWPPGPLPGASMPDRGAELVSLTLAHPRHEALRHALAPLVDLPSLGIVPGSDAALTAVLRTPAGSRRLH